MSPIKKKKAANAARREKRRTKASVLPSRNTHISHYRKLGYPLFPVHSIVDGKCTCGNRNCANPGKHPSGKYASKGHKSATKKLPLINQWRNLKLQYNIGIATGDASRIIVVDIDKKNGGLETLAKLEAKHGKLPATATVITGGGGKHFYFAMPEDVDIRSGTNVLGAGIDIRANGGCIIAPPSRHKSNKLYRWVKGRTPWQTPPAPIPDWILKRLTKKKKPKTMNTTGDNGWFTEGQRNDTLTRIAGSIRQYGVDTTTLLESLKLINQKKCKPPLPIVEVSSIANSVGRYPTSNQDLALPWEPFPVNVLPSWLKDFTQQSATAIGCDQSMIAMGILAVASGAIGNSTRLQLKTTWTEPAVLWMAIVADSGTTKSPAYTFAMSAVEEQEKYAREYFQEAIREWNADDQKGLKPQLRRYHVEDTTIEALTQRLQENPRGLLLARDELSGWFNSFNAYRSGKGGDDAHWLNMHGARSLTVDRKTGDMPTIQVPNAAVSVYGNIQPGTLQRCLSDQHLDSGLAARLLMAMPLKIQKVWNEVEVPEHLLKEYTHQMRSLYQIQGSLSSTKQIQPVMLSLTPPAKSLFIDFYNTHNEEQFQLSGNLGAAWAKLEGYTARFALVLTMLDWAFQGGSSSPPQVVSPSAMRRAIELTQWFSHETRRIYSFLGSREAVKQYDKTLDFVRQNGGDVTAYELSRKASAYKQDGSPEQALDRLAKQGFGRWEERKPGKGGGCPTTAFVLL